MVAVSGKQVSFRRQSLFRGCRRLTIDVIGLGKQRHQKEASLREISRHSQQVKNKSGRSELDLKMHTVLVHITYSSSGSSSSAVGQVGVISSRVHSQKACLTRKHEDCQLSQVLPPETGFLIIALTFFPTHRPKLYELYLPKRHKRRNLTQKASQG